MIRITAALIMLASSVHGAEYNCPVETKFDSFGGLYSAEKRKRDQYDQYSVRIRDMGDTAIVERCSYVQSKKRVTCDSYEVDYIAHDILVGHKKFYYFRGQFDVQLFDNLSFVENNGRGTIAFGNCTLTRP
jgi:hypothetical protein